MNNEKNKPENKEKIFIQIKTKKLSRITKNLEKKKILKKPTCLLKVVQPNSFKIL